MHLAHLYIVEISMSVERRGKIEKGAWSLTDVYWHHIRSIMQSHWLNLLINRRHRGEKQNDHRGAINVN